jgi:PASTA domain
MSVRLSALGLGVVALLTTAALTYAADKQITSAPRAVPQVTAQPQTLVVPDVRRQAYVFAKGILVDSGFAWRVQGGVRGFSANLVATQTPAPGTRVLDNGAPTILLTLERNGKYGQKGSAQDVSPYAGTPLKLADLASDGLTPVSTAPAATTPAAPAAKPKPAPAAAAKPAAKPKSKPAAPPKRTPAFTVAGAPIEPLDEMPLPDRAKLLGRWLAAHPKPTNANVKHWLYQNEWIVQGAKFGWWRGAEALKLLVQVDRRAESAWGIGSKSGQVAAAALAEVKAKTA